MGIRSLEGVCHLDYLEPGVELKVAAEIVASIKQDKLILAKRQLDGLRREEKKLIVSQILDGKSPFFLAVQHGLAHFVEYFLNDCHADVEQRGVYEMAKDGSKHHVTPLWCASVANKLDVVKMLLRHNAQVSAKSDTGYTPAEIAWCASNTEIVMNLLESGADLRTSSIGAATCAHDPALLLFEMCALSLEREKHFDVSSRDSAGRTVLHHAAREGSVKATKICIQQGSDPDLKDKSGVDAYQTAANYGCIGVMQELLRWKPPSMQRHIDLYKLLGAYFILEKGRAGVQRGLEHWRFAMRLSEKVITEKAQNPAYKLEPTSMTELEGHSTPDALLELAITIRERILGPQHEKTYSYITRRGAGLLSPLETYQHAIDVWKNRFSCIASVTVLLQLYYSGYNPVQLQHLVSFEGAYELFLMSVSELESAQLYFAEHDANSKALQTMVLLTMRLMILICAVPEPTDSDKRLQFECAVYRLNKTGILLSNGQSPLHVALDSEIPADVSRKVVELLLRCGADPNAADNEGNTPLHLLSAAARDARNDRVNMQAIARALLKYKAHVDFTNSSGAVADEALPYLIEGYNQSQYLTLNCYAASRVRRCNLKAMRGFVSQKALEFAERHCRQ